MRLATVRTEDGTRAARVTSSGRYQFLDAPDVGALLAREGWARAVVSLRGKSHHLDAADLAPVVPRPGTILCAGINYRGHILETGRGLPAHPALSAGSAGALIGARDGIRLPPGSPAAGWAAGLAVVIGHTVRRATREAAEDAIAGFTIMSGVTVRDERLRIGDGLRAETPEGTAPLGPVLVTPDELRGGVRPALPLTCRVDGKAVREADTSDLVFDPVDLVRYASAARTLRPGDVIATGTPGGPPRHLANGMTVVTEIGGIGRLENRVLAP